MNEKLENFPTSESAKRQLSYVSKDFYRNSYIGKWLFQVMGMEFDDTRKIVEELPKQFFPETATWGLMYHEIKWGLPVRENLSYEERRRNIYLKRDFKAPMTPYRMEEYLSKALEFHVTIKDCNDSDGEKFVHPNIFKVIFSGEGTVNTKFAKQLLNQIKQSHTLYSLHDKVDMILFEIIKSEVSIAMKGEFYPRYNLPYLMYDGTVPYNKYKYNGYKTDSFVDLYPTKLSYSIPRLFVYDHIPKIGLHDKAKQQIKNKETKIFYLSETNPKVGIGNRLKIKTTHKGSVPTYQVSLTVGKHLTQYNGKYQYNGTRKYDSKIIHEVL